MRRSANITAPQPMRKPVSLTDRPAAAVESADGGPVVSRVRDSLVLRRVRQKKAVAKSPSDARSAR